MNIGVESMSQAHQDELFVINSIHVDDENLVFMDYYDEHTGNVAELNVSIHPDMREPLAALNKILAQYV